MYVVPLLVCITLCFRDNVYFARSYTYFICVLRVLPQQRRFNGHGNIKGMSVGFPGFGRTYYIVAALFGIGMRQGALLPLSYNLIEIPGNSDEPPVPFSM